MKRLNDISILSASFNNHRPTLEMLKSFLRHSDYLMHFYILDNSTDTPIPLDSTPDITVLDNRNFKHTSDYKQPSKNHCSSLMWAFTQIQTKYVLLCDNDILFKPAINDWLNQYTKYDCIGEIGFDLVPPNRLFPYCCIIDLNFVHVHNIRYFDECRCMVANRIKDTGSSFYDDLMAEHASINEVRINDVCVHLKGATLRNKDLNPFYLIHQKLRG